MILKIQYKLLLNKCLLSILSLGDNRQLGITGKRKRGGGEEEERRGTGGVRKDKAGGEESRGGER